MHIEKILLKNYRNLKEIFLDLNPNLNIIIGNNGQGKTNLLESIYYLGTGKSHRSNNDQELINWDREKALIQVKLVRRDQTLKISFYFNGTHKRVEINDTPLSKVTELIGNLNVVLFSPENINLVKGGPAYRRSFLDTEVSQVSSYYYHLLLKYNHVLKQRNNLLKEIRDTGKGKEMLEIWDEELTEIGSKIIIKRIEVIEKLKILARLTQRQITNGSENLSIEYDCSLKGELKGFKNVKLIFKKELVNNREKEIKRGYTLSGPHRDDLILKINNMDVRKYGSQGQQRTTALALKLAELEFMKSETGEYPVLLLDDVFSELDKYRRRTLIDLIVDKIQTFITATDFDNINRLSKNSYFIFEVNKGKIEGR